jgi:hypothetical protein
MIPEGRRGDGNMRNYARDRSHAEDRERVAPNERCPFCETKLWIAQSRERYVVTLEKMLHLVLKDKRCPSPTCSYPTFRYRPPEELLKAILEKEGRR